MDASASTAASSSATHAGAEAMRVLERNTRAVVCAALAQHSLRGGDPATGVVEWHDRTARALHAAVLDHGTDAMSTTAAYAIAAIEAGLLYPGEELDEFVQQVSASVRSTFRALSKGTPSSA